MAIRLDALFPGQAPVLLDGAMGTALQARGWPAGEPTLLANLEAGGLVLDVHREHRDAGADVLTTNTFSALMVGDARCAAATRSAVRLARQAADGRCRVAGSVAAFGLAVDDPQLREVVAILVEEGIDLLVFETCHDVRDAAAALELHADLAPRLPVVICASSTSGDRADSTHVRDIVQRVRGDGDARVEVGLNCCRGPYDALRLALAASPPVRWVKPSTGLPGDRVGADVMAAFARAARLNGVRFVGGCCGTDGEMLVEMAAALRAAPA